MANTSIPARSNGASGFLIVAACLLLLLSFGYRAGFGQFAIVPLAQLLIDAYSWATALNILAGSALLMAVLAIPLASYSGRQPAGKAQKAEDQTVPQALQEAMQYRSFLLLVMGFFVCGFHVAFITAHMPAFITDLGFDPQLGAWSISIIGLCNVFGAYISGVVSGKMSMRYLLVCIYSARAVVITLFMVLPVSLASVLVFSATMGFLWLATVPPTSGLVALMFGTRYMAMLYGIVFLGHQVGSFIGVWLGGWLHDHSGSYDLVWWTGAALGLMAALVHWLISERPVERRIVETV
ncbi:MAG: MFS transporter [Desulfobacterales bacterium]|nr:MFS transporter [Desulfobacterales bacterium]